MMRKSYKKSDCEKLMAFLEETPKDLIDAYSITQKLNEDLVGLIYLAPRRSTAKSSSSSPERRPDIKSDSTPSSPPSRVDLREGIIDKKTGQRRYYIKRIIKYEPGRGYFVHWKGFSEADRTWQLEKDMPECWSKKMKAARERYRKSLLALPLDHSR